MALRREVYDEFPAGRAADRSDGSSPPAFGGEPDPGVIGTLTLTSTDPQIAKGTGRHKLQPRQMILPGMFMRLDGLHGAYRGRW